MEKPSEFSAEKAGTEIPRSESSRLMRSAFSVGAITFLSRISGLLRENTHARFLGTGDASDAFRIALIIPNLFRRLVGEGAITSCFVPVFVAYSRKEDREGVRIFAEAFYTLWSLVLLAVCLAGIAMTAAGGWILLSNGAHVTSWPPEKLELALSLTKWLFGYIFFIGLSAVGQGILNASGVFALPASTPLLYNLAFVAAGFLLAGLFPGEAAAWSLLIGVLAGGFLQFAILAPPLWRRGLRFRPRWPGSHPGVYEVLRLLGPGAFGAGVYQINVMISAFIASNIPGAGVVSSLGFASRLMEFVLGVFVFSLSTVSLTTLSQKAAAEDWDGVRATLSEVLRLAGFITIPSTIGFVALGRPIIQLLLKSGRFDEQSVQLTLEAFWGYLPGLYFIGLSRVMVSTFYSLKDIWTPVRVGVVNLLVNGILSWLLAGTALLHAGVALASSIAVVAQAVYLAWALQRRQRLLAVSEIMASAGRALAAAAVMGLSCWLPLRFLPAAMGKVELLVVVGLEVAGGALIFFAAAWLLGAPESKVLFSRWWRRR